VDRVSLDLGEINKETKSMESRGGKLTERGDRSIFVIENARKAGVITLCLKIPQRRRLVFRVNRDGGRQFSEERFQITQMNDQYEVVGGIELLVRDRDRGK
jgi:hypothetical protein